MDDKPNLDVGMPSRPDAGTAEPAGGPDAPPYINLGHRLRLGLLQPSVNNVAEPTLNAMLPKGVSLHTTRLKLIESDAKSLLESMTEKIEEACALLADCAVDRILFHCTAVTVHDPGVAESITSRISAAAGVPANVTSEGIIAAFERLGASRIVLVAPYIQEVTDNEVAFFKHFGISVVREHGLEMAGARQFEAIEPSTWYRITMENRDDRADAYFISCASSRASEAIGALEYDLGRPVVTSNTAATWHCLRESGINDHVPGFGALFRL